MNVTLRQRTKSMTHVHQPQTEKESLHELFYLLDRSLKRYGYLQKNGASEDILDLERDLFSNRLQALRVQLRK